MGRIADLWFSGRLDDGPLQVDAKKSGDKAGKTLGASMSESLKKSFSSGELGKGLVQGLGLAGALGGAQLLTKGLGVMTDFIGESIDAASDLNESMSKSGVIFGEASKDVENFASTADKALGLSKQAALEAAASFGNLFLGTGQSQEKAAELSKSMVTLAGDLASFNNLDPTDALEKLRSGLTGEAEPLRSMGVFLTEAKVKAKAMEMGLADAHGELSEGAKVMARYAVIMDETKTAQGDFARTADGAANSQRSLNAEMENAKAALGQDLLPLEQKWIQAQRDAIPVIIDATKVLGNMGDGIVFLREKWRDLGIAESLGDRTLRDLHGTLRLVGGTVDHTAQDVSEAADKIDHGLDSMATHSAKGADKMVTSAKRVGTAYQHLRIDLLGDAQKIVTDYYDRLILEDNLRANTYEINAQRLIIASKTSTDAQKRDARIALHQLEADQAQMLQDLAAHGASTTATFNASMDVLLKRLKGAHGAELKAIQAEIRALILLSAKAAAAKGNIVALTLGKNGYVSAAGAAALGGSKPKPVGTGHNATGGTLRPGEVSWVGERGPELWVPEVAGRVIPHGQSVQMASQSSGGTTIQQTIYGTPMQPVTPRIIALEARRISRLHRLPGSPAEGFDD